MQLLERIEKRRFVGREFLLWLWFEGELFDETLHVAPHGELGLAIERELALSNGKETTRIQGQEPARTREAKESLRLGKLPERATFRLVLGEREATFSLKAESLAVGGLALPRILTEGDHAAPGELGAPAAAPRRKRRTSVEEDAEREADGRSEVLLDRLDRTREIEAILEALYRDFLRLRLGEAWSSLVMPALRAWIAGEPLDEESYRESRRAALEATRTKTKPASSSHSPQKGASTRGAAKRDAVTTKAPPKGPARRR
ncbi:MAG: hypothetical protein FJ096_08370 [Deltaproteobacteria bacterium]|nr:hypothetical protein [Deltaproteobacteria bacterium]